MHEKKRAGKLGYLLLFGILLAGCGGSSSSDSGSSDTNGDASGTTGTEGTDGQSNALTLINTFKLPYGYEEGNILVDENHVILVGGIKGWPTGGSHNGHNAFTDKIYVLDLETGVQSDYVISRYGLSNPQFGTGIGNDAIIRKLGSNKYLIYGGYQYVTATFILDLNTNSLAAYTTSMVEITDTDHGGLNKTPFFANIQASAILDNGDHVFFGFNNGLYGLGTVVLFDSNTFSYSVLTTQLEIPRHNIDAYKLSDNQVLLVGGWDGTALTAHDSATRRVTLYNTATNTLERVADYPEPKSGGQHRVTQIPETETEICVGNHTYIIAEKSWQNGCEIPSPINTQQYVQPPMQEPYTVGTYLGQATNGQVLFIERKYQGTTNAFDDDCNCNPYNEGVKIHVYTVAE